MTRCDHCGRMILYGGISPGPNHNFCDVLCHQNAYLLSVAYGLPESEVREAVARRHSGPCPCCGGPGPVDVHLSQYVWSAVILTTTEKNPITSCRRCGRRRQVEDLLRSLLFGWWGFPWGLVLTPVQLLRNAAAILTSPDPLTPSRHLEGEVGLEIARNRITSAQVPSP